LSEAKTLNGHAPPLAELPEEQAPTVDLTLNDLNRYQAAAAKVLQWSEGGAAPRPISEDVRVAMWALNQTRDGKKSPGCYEWVAKRLEIDRSTLHRVLKGDGIVPGTYILAVQALIFADWVRAQGYEPRDIFSDKTDTALARTLREKVKGYVPPDEVKAPLSLDEMEDEWENMCLQIVENGLTLTEGEFQELGSKLASVSHRIAAKYIREEKGAKGKYYVDHANRVVSDATAGRINL